VTVPGVCVVDASVGVKRLRQKEALWREARAVIDRGSAGVGARLVPGLFDLECAHAVVKLHRRAELSEEESLEAVRLLYELPLVRVPSRPLLPHAARLALDSGISAYDAVYVMLAVALGVPLVTADDRLVRAMAGAPVEMVRLADIEA
jgi:predicted nucleic acid-binding protein